MSHSHKHAPARDTGTVDPAPAPDADAPAAAAAAEAPAAGVAPDVLAQLQRAEAEALQMKDAYLRAKAETENVRKQAANDVSKAYKFAIEKFAEELLPVRDALELSLAAPNASLDTLRSGVELTLKQLTGAFEKSQVKEVAPAGQKFDPHFHQAMAMVDSDQPANTVVTVFQKGYLLNDRVLRPALVAVAKAKE